MTPEAEDFRWRAADGLAIQGWLYRPRGTSRGVIVHVHGGPTAHSADRLYSHIQYLVAQGFTVLDPNYRGSTGFGLAFQQAIKHDGWGGQEQQDIHSGIEALLAAGIAQPGKVGITGTSYGGYSSWCAITRYPLNSLAAAVPICGMTDLAIDYYTTRPDLRPLSESMMGGTPEQLPRLYHERSPIILWIALGRLLIVQGLQDPMSHPKTYVPYALRLTPRTFTMSCLPLTMKGMVLAARPTKLCSTSACRPFSARPSLLVDRPMLAACLARTPVYGGGRWLESPPGKVEYNSASATIWRPIRYRWAQEGKQAAVRSSGLSALVHHSMQVDRVRQVRR